MANLAQRIAQEFNTLRTDELSVKANVIDVANLLANKADSSDVYTKSESDTNFEPADATIVREESTHTITNKTIN